jgi:hypothetical protein
VRAVTVRVTVGVTGRDVDGVAQHAVGADAVLPEERHGVPALVFEHAFVGHRVHGDGLPGRHPGDGLGVFGGKPAPDDGVVGRGQVVPAVKGTFVRLEEGEGHDCLLSGSAAMRSISTAASTASPVTPTQVRLGRGPVNHVS